MDVMGISIDHIVDLATQIATTGTLRVNEFFVDDLFEYTVAMSALIYESTYPFV